MKQVEGYKASVFFFKEMVELKQEHKKQKCCLLQLALHVNASIRVASYLLVAEGNTSNSAL